MLTTGIKKASTVLLVEAYCLWQKKRQEGHSFTTLRTHFRPSLSVMLTK